MQEQLHCVATFHQAIGAQVAERPQLLDGDLEQALYFSSELRKMNQFANEVGTVGGPLIQRFAMVLEELAEWLEAHVNRDLVAAADAWGDRCYLLLGDAIAAGLPANEVFQEIHRSNMTKIEKFANRLGKAQKNERFRTPDLNAILFKQPAD